MGERELGQPNYRIVIEKDVAIRTHDGVTLRSDVYRPDTSGKFPVLVVRRSPEKKWHPYPKTKIVYNSLPIRSAPSVRESGPRADIERDGTCV